MTNKKREKKTDAEHKTLDEKQELLDQINTLKESIKEKEDQLLRSIADYQNYQNRVQKEKELIKNDTQKIYLSELLDIKELLLQAFDDKNPKEGLRLILKQLEQFLEEENIYYINCIGQTFNHTQHHAVTTIEKKDEKDNTIIEEVKKGYMVGDKVLRPSHVIVVKNKCEEE